ncbi:hypothetical protein [Neobacillus kokaensis]|uniref:Uncharacterized protein n=1 Tax=Neobacillus kokaensis TaxID=2759023 RepID=A0ABQ3MWD7_9BACI|nr:hypothetical protein [Neobacillus kokaensis]GHH96998.1 hypothetical protein AM1BK_05410 [Neobacillus kokaensis]
MINMTELQQIKQFSKRLASIGKLQYIPGIWVNGKYFWLQNRMEKVIYEEGLIIKVEQKHLHSKIHFFNIFVSNHSHQSKDIKILAMHHFQNAHQDHLTFVSPTDQRIFHHAGQNVFLVNLMHNESETKEYTTMPLWNVYTNQIWSSLQNGTLKYQPMAKGPAASILAEKITVSPQKTEKISTWTIAGKNKNEVIAMEQALLKIH